MQHFHLPCCKYKDSDSVWPEPWPRAALLLSGILAVTKCQFHPTFGLTEVRLREEAKPMGTIKLRAMDPTGLEVLKYWDRLFTVLGSTTIRMLGPIWAKVRTLGYPVRQDDKHNSKHVIYIQQIWRRKFCISERVFVNSKADNHARDGALQENCNVALNEALE